MSGDVGVIMPNGSVKIIDRAKNIFKLAQGEYIAPEKLENVYGQSPYISQVYVHGDSLQSYLVAVVVPELEECEKFFQSTEGAGGQSRTLDEVCESDAMREAILADMNALAAKNKLNGLERIKKIFLHNEEFTQENGLLTPSMKLKRQVAIKQFRQQIDMMYV